MAIVKPKKHPPHTDMTAMTDVAFLLLTFFIMTATFKTNDAEVTTPSSVSTIKVPDDKIMIISIDKAGKVYFGVDAPPTRMAMLDNIAQAKGISFTELEKQKFALQSSFGFPLNQLKAFLATPDAQKAQIKQPGIPVDSTGTSELADWVYAARKADPGLRIALKGDNLAKFPVFKDVLGNLQSQNINKFNLITASEDAPAGFKMD
ncbi:biopolymer transporter ExbD [Dyadobacter sp. LHD-138]|jgi:biopolymer transport protein ExbD|uniref:ExbD/TolR family protein n=1 Tax=Dyadobacter sp. LHD-138 TaxID=3071413 RepID=UPI0027E127F0|nr:biopolymer transporter ExbD [Dyadobacter sp. LHD-138]MDQ6477785.1 biopolymer transporter ExbD [Dyadobacter sp. LHD-138]